MNELGGPLGVAVIALAIGVVALSVVMFLWPEGVRKCRHVWTPERIIYLEHTWYDDVYQTDTTLEKICERCGKLEVDRLAKDKLTKHTINRILKIKYGDRAFQLKDSD